MYNERNSLQGKIVLITGALGILGRRFCEGFAEMGASLALLDLPEVEDAKFVKSLEDQYKTAVQFYPCNLLHAQEIQSTVQSVIAKFGKIDVLLNNAASKSKDLNAFFESFENYSLEEWKQIFSVNVDGTFLMTQAAGKQMLQQDQGGVVINIASIYGVVAPDQRIYEGSSYLGRQISSPAVYSASKAAVIGLTSYLAAYWGDKKIRVNCITPGGVESGQNDVFQKKYSARVPMGRMAQADEIVGAALYLASENATYVNGHNLIVDGGLTTW
jgi:NAD(P)-dependent dehydrogenase (short-subunit alcohol dehydrogenase family)